MTSEPIQILLEAPFAGRLTHLDLGDWNLGQTALERLARSPVLEGLLWLRVEPESSQANEELRARFGSRVVFG